MHFSAGRPLKVATQAPAVPVRLTLDQPSTARRPTTCQSRPARLYESLHNMRKMRDNVGFRFTKSSLAYPHAKLLLARCLSLPNPMAPRQRRHQVLALYQSVIE